MSSILQEKFSKSLRTVKKGPGKRDNLNPIHIDYHELIGMAITALPNLRDMVEAFHLDGSIWIINARRGGVSSD